MCTTRLKDRILWFDGTCQVKPTLVPELLLGGVQPDHISVLESNADIDQFNFLSEIPIGSGKTANVPLDLEYNIPKSYKDIDLAAFCTRLLSADKKRDIPSYRTRLDAELLEIRTRDMEMLVRTLIYVLDTFASTRAVWGVGRGSSCASLVLFIIGLHKVDPVKYSIPMEEFFH